MRVCVCDMHLQCTPTAHKGKSYRANSDLTIHKTRFAELFAWQFMVLQYVCRVLFVHTHADCCGMHMCAGCVCVCVHLCVSFHMHLLYQVLASRRNVSNRHKFAQRACLYLFDANKSDRYCAPIMDGEEVFFFCVIGMWY